MHPDDRYSNDHAYSDGRTGSAAPGYPDASRRSVAPACLPHSAMAIAGLVVGLVALLTSFIPIVNNASFFLALLGLVFAIVGLVATVRGTRSGKGLAIAALVVSIVAGVVVLATQALYSAVLDQAVDEALNGPAVTGVAASSDAGGASSSNASDASDDASGQASQQAEDLAVGSAVQLANGLSVSVDEVQTGLVNYDGSTVTGVRVTYTNGGSSEASFNTYDWKGQDAQGAQQYTTYYTEAVETLSSGTLAPGGTVTGMVYFAGDLTKVLYYSSMLASSPTASWAVA